MMIVFQDNWFHHRKNRNGFFNGRLIAWHFETRCLSPTPVRGGSATFLRPDSRNTVECIEKSRLLGFFTRVSRGGFVRLRPGPGVLRDLWSSAQQDRQQHTQSQNKQPDRRCRGPHGPQSPLLTRRMSWIEQQPSRVAAFQRKKHEGRCSSVNQQSR